MEQRLKSVEESKKRVFVKVPDHYRSTPYIADSPKGRFIERRLINPKQRHYCSL